MENKTQQAGLSFGSRANSFPVDPVPRLITAGEWDLLQRALAQRARALNEFVADVYGPRRIVSSGVIPDSAIASADYYEPEARSALPANGIWCNVCGFDLVRGSDGKLQVLEDNVRSPSGMTFAIAIRKVIESAVPAISGYAKIPAERGFEQLRNVFIDAAPESDHAPTVLLLTDGPSCAGWFEHSAISERLMIATAMASELVIRDGYVYVELSGELQVVDVIYRRTDVDRLKEPNGTLSSLGEQLIEPLRNGTVGCVNSFGAGVADDKLIHAYVEKMIAFYLDEEPLIDSVKTYDLGNEDSLKWVQGNIEKLVIKPRAGLGGRDVSIGPLADEKQLADMRETIAKMPEKYVAQDTVQLSTHPTIHNGNLEPRHIDLRVFAFQTRNGVEVMPCCLTRVATQKGEMIVNSSRNGGGKDTWILR